MFLYLTFSPVKPSYPNIIFQATRVLRGIIPTSFVPGMIDDRRKLSRTEPIFLDTFILCYIRVSWTLDLDFIRLLSTIFLMSASLFKLIQLVIKYYVDCLCNLWSALVFFDFIRVNRLYPFAYVTCLLTSVHK